jgi:hypothetical protein
VRVYIYYGGTFNLWLRTSAMKYGLYPVPCHILMDSLFRFISKFTFIIAGYAVVHYGPRVALTLYRNEYRRYLLWVKAASA